MISIVDYGMGNLRSVEKALQKLGHDTELVSTPKAVESSTKLVLPGVGAFGDAMRGLRDRGLVAPLRQYAASGRPLFGICLGMQILFESSEEDPGIEGLGVLRGDVRRFPVTQLKVPHMGWNRLQIVGSSRWFRELGSEPFVYFVHSYFVVPTDNGVTATETEYGMRFTSAVAKDNIGGTQFHPEKSQATGLKILNNFATSDQAQLSVPAGT